MKKRNWLILLLCAVMAVSMFAGCASSGEGALKYDISRDTNIYAETDTGAKVVAMLHPGTTLNCLETKKVGDQNWGRMLLGWVLLDELNVHVPQEKTEPQETAGEGTQPPETTVPETTAEPVVLEGIITRSTLYVRSGPSSDHEKVTEYKAGDHVVIHEIQKSESGTKWGRSKDGWMNIAYIYTPGAIGGDHGFAVVVKDEALLFEKLGSRDRCVGKLDKGKRVELLECITIKGETWGYCNGSWVSTKDLYVEGSEGENACDGVVTAGTLNVRRGPSTKFEKVTTFKKGREVHVYEQFYLNGTTWGYVGKGWVSMEYIQKNAPAETTMPES